jgi:acetylornithine deacetylase/succinyl-diaminopimelate desuccinylase-like protein
MKDELERLVRIPSVAGPDVFLSAKMTAELFEEAGAAEVEIASVPGGAPAVIATFPGPVGKPTVLLYAHHDVQPAGDGWDSPPFEPVERDGRLYGRGTADDKGGIVVHLAALRAFDGKPPVGVTVFVEGEEETGSPTLAAFLDRYRDRLAADVVVLADGDNWDVGQPALTVGLRGVVDCVVELRTLATNVHSGSFGGVAPDALTAMVRLLASLHDDEGLVTIGGTGGRTDVVIPEERFRAESGMLDGVRTIGRGSVADRLWNQVALTVLAIDSPKVDEAANALQASARAKISVRVPPGFVFDDVFSALHKHIMDHIPWGAHVTIERGESAQPYALETTGVAYDAAREAFETAWEVPPVEIGSGGSLPMVAAFAEAFPDAAVLITGVADPRSNPHAPNESVDLGDLDKACLAETLLLSELARRT